MKLGFGCLLWSASFLLLVLAVFVLSPSLAEARNIREYSDTITDSRPLDYSNHTFQFTILSAVPAGSVFTFDFPTGFVIRNSTSTFDTDNVEFYDDGILRAASTTQTATQDKVTINSGDGGSLVYTLNTSTGVAAGSVIRFLVGNHTANSYSGGFAYSSTTGTTTIPADVEPIQNSSIEDTYVIDMTVSDGSEIANADFHIVLLEQIGVGPLDTTETIPPYRFNPAPTSTVGGTTLFVEISLETDELAICKYDSVASTSYGAMPNTFDVTGQIVHSSVVPVTLGALNIYYVRCLDDEGNFNTDDFLIAFSANDQPTGDPNSEGNVEGDGTGTGNDGSGSGSGGGGNTGGTEGDASTSGSQSGTGGSGGGSGGSRGEDSTDQTGGGFESGDAPYRSGDAEVVIKGYAFPGSKIYALVDGSTAKTATANSQGSFSVTLDGIARGVYTFGIYAVDDNDVKSTTFSTSFTVTGGRTSELSNINIMPSILVDPDPVNVGEVLTITGFSIPDATITIENMKEGSSQSLKSFTTTSDSNGEWSVSVDTNGFSDNSTYKVRAKAEQSGGIKTNYSDYTFYGVGQAADVPLNADLNRDGSVNLTDFSILLFWWGGDGGDSDPPADINQDGSVSLTDFSIMLFQWTG